MKLRITPMFKANQNVCLANDVVLAILVLLRSFQKVLHINVDSHPSCVVEEAFYTTDRVLTFSFHVIQDNDQ